MLPILILFGCKGKESDVDFDEGGGVIRGKSREVYSDYGRGYDRWEIQINKRGTKYTVYKNGY